jgi:amidase
MRRLKRENTVPHGQRYRVYEPVMTIHPGETIVVETINHMTPVVKGIEDLHAHGSSEYREREETGPVCVEGAEPGEMLAVKIEKIEVVGIPHAHGSGPLADVFRQEPLLFPHEGGRITFPGGLSAPYAPMVGDIYTTPKEPKGNFFDHGGNMDFTEVKPGNTLHLPVFREGGLLVMGDVHAAQGDGEIYGEAAETAADVTVTIDIDRRYRCPRPMVETADSLICLAGRGVLFESLKLVVRDMTELLARLYGVREEEAYILCTTIGSLRTAGCVCYAGKSMEKWTLAALSVPKDIQKIREK